MPKTYYDSELTAEQIEDALTAIDGVVNPGNNGKVLYIEDGKIKAASASRWSGGAVLEPLSVTANGDYYPPTGTDGFDEVHVDVSGGGGGVVQPINVTANGTYNPPSGVDGYAPVTVNVSGGLKRYGYNDVTFTNTTTDSNIGNAETGHITTALLSSAGAASGAEQVIYTTDQIDLTYVQFLICKVYSAKFDSGSAGGMYFGASETLPSSYTSAIQSSSKDNIAGTYNSRIFIIDVSAVSGQYYLFFASKVTYSTTGAATADFEIYAA